MKAVVEEAGCGTARCAAGWCLVDPWFLANTPLGAFAEYAERGMSTPLRGALLETFDLLHADDEALFGGELSVYGSPHAVPKAEVLANIDTLLAGGHARRYRAVGY